MELTKGAIYYTDNRPKSFILEECQDQIKRAWSGKLISVSLIPINFGENIVLEGRVRCYPTMVKQIVMGLEALDTDVVFFLEHDVLYHPSHFYFTPPREDMYYYNLNNWRWNIKEDFVITYDYLRSLSQLCCFRKTALKHFQARLKYIEHRGLDKEVSREPHWVRALGYEPGTKLRKKGGFSDEIHDVWRSEWPNIDIRHRHTFSPPKTHLADFHHPPVNWQEMKLEDFPYWDLKKLQDAWLDKYRIN